MFALCGDSVPSVNQGKKVCAPAFTACSSGAWQSPESAVFNALLACHYSGHPNVGAPTISVCYRNVQKHKCMGTKGLFGAVPSPV